MKSKQKLIHFKPRSGKFIFVFESHAENDYACDSSDVALISTRKSQATILICFSDICHRLGRSRGRSKVSERDRHWNRYTNRNPCLPIVINANHNYSRAISHLNKLNLSTDSTAQSFLSSHLISAPLCAIEALNGKPPTFSQLIISYLFHYPFILIIVNDFQHGDRITRRLPAEIV